MHKVGFEIDSWHLNNTDDTLIKEETEFKENTRVFTKSKLKKITITVVGDTNIEIATANTFIVDAFSNWTNIKAQAETIASAKENFEIDSWHLNNTDGTLIKEETEFKENTKVFAKSKRQKITITVKGDENINIGTPNTVSVAKGAKWADIKTQVEGKAIPKENFEIIEWHLNNADGILIEYETEFKVNTIIFAVSKRKVVQYKVEHYQENIESSEYYEKYTLYETEFKTGEAGKDTNAEAKQYDGFYCRYFSQNKINSDGSTIVQIRYKRKIIALILDLDGGKTTTQLKDGEGGKKLLEGKFGAKVEVKNLEKEDCRFEKWEPALPQTFPKENDGWSYVAKWEKAIRITLKGDERIEVKEPGYIDVSIASPKTFRDIKDEIHTKIDLAYGWRSDYGFYDWRIGGEKGDEMLNSTQIKDDITLYARTNYGRFDISITTLNGYEGEKPRGRIFIPENIEIIGEKAFRNCDGLTAVDFSGCSGLKRIEASDHYAGGAFSSCDSLESIDLSPCIKLERIGASAFYRCDKLRSVNLTGCSELIYIEGSEHAGIGYNYRGAFENCISLKTIDLSQCKKLRGILKGAFANCTSLESIGLSQCTELKQIGDSAFANCTSLENIDLSPCKKFEKIGCLAFKNCSKLKNVNLSGCSELITFDDGLNDKSYVGRFSAFYGCTSLESVDLSGCIKIHILNAFYGCTSLKSVDLTGCNELRVIAGFSNCVSLEAIDLSPCKKLEKIGERAFSGCSKLKSVNLSHYTEITEIGKEAFQNCVSLEAIDLSSSYYRFVEIVSSSFSGCSKAVVKLPAIIEVIGKDAFGGDNETYCKKVLVPNQTIRQLVISSGYPVTRIEMY